MFDAPDRKDSELLELCATFLSVRTSVSAVPDEEDLTQALMARDFLAAQIRTIPPLSPEGVRAKAQVGVVLLEEEHPPGLADQGVSFALTILRELATGEPCAGLEVTEVEAGLLAACAAFDTLEHEAVTLQNGPGRIEDDEVRGRALAIIVGR